MSKRKSPRRHVVRQHRRENKIVHRYVRGHGLGSPSRAHGHCPSYLSPIGDGRLMRPVESKEYIRYLGRSLHGGLLIQKTPDVVELRVSKIDMDQIDPVIVDRPDFDRAVKYHIDELRQGRLFSPLLVHRVNGRYVLLDGNARYLAMKELGMHGSIEVVENGFADKLRSFGSKVKEATKSQRAMISFNAAVDRERLKQAGKGWLRGVGEEGKRNLAELFHSGEVNKLIRLSSDPDAIVRTNSRATLARKFPLIYEQQTFAPQRTVQTIVQGPSYAEQRVEKAEREKASRDELQKIRDKITAEQNVTDWINERRAEAKSRGKMLSESESQVELAKAMKKEFENGIFTKEELREMQDKADGFAKKFKEEDRRDFTSRIPYNEQMARSRTESALRIPGVSEYVPHEYHAKPPKSNKHRDVWESGILLKKKKEPEK